MQVGIFITSYKITSPDTKIQWLCLMIISKLNARIGISNPAKQKFRVIYNFFSKKRKLKIEYYAILLSKVQRDLTWGKKKIKEVPRVASKGNLYALFNIDNLNLVYWNIPAVYTEEDLQKIDTARFLIQSLL